MLTHWLYSSSYFLSYLQDDHITPRQDFYDYERDEQIYSFMLHKKYLYMKILRFFQIEKWNSNLSYIDIKVSVNYDCC